MKSECIIRAIEKNRQTCGKFKMANSNSTLIKTQLISITAPGNKGKLAVEEIGFLMLRKTEISFTDILSNH